MKDMSMKAVKRLGKSCKNLFKMDNARVLLLEMAKDSKESFSVGRSHR